MKQMIQEPLHDRLKKKGHIIIHGFYGAGNLGDEVILSATLSQIHSLQGVRPVIFSRNPAETHAMHRVSSVNPYTKHGIAGYLNLLRSTVYILGGGGLLKDYGDSPRSIEDWLGWLVIAKRFGLKTMLWSIGVENLRFDRSKRLIRRVLSTVDAITVRDPDSRKRLEEIGVQNHITVTADPAILKARKHSKQRSLRRNPRVIVCLRHWFKYGYFVPDAAAHERMLNSIATVLDFLATVWNAEIELVPFRTSSHDNDKKILEMLVSRIHENHNITIHSQVPQIDEVINILSDADLVVGMRLHSLILATSLGVPSIALSYMPKVRDYMTYINQRRFCFDIEDVDAHRLREAVEEIMNNYEEISKQVILTTSDLSEGLQENVRILSRLLEQ